MKIVKHVFDLNKSIHPLGVKVYEIPDEPISTPFSDLFLKKQDRKLAKVANKTISLMAKHIKEGK